ncbi:processed acidic surface protein [Neobacillus sp. DY30]|uniref:processed acidic surface protein n=1 Tax=Neobacillus sp. DY30 TaxID=3047871 RepID=UPI0024C09279|nr:processed acidic surface protein [Neobacillus sp. DY30]WHY00581.1 processed acidic surface protein [Neobacillus sp. DY30]
MKILMHSILAILLLLTVSPPMVSAAVQQEEIDQLLAEMNWSMEELQDYLAYYETTVADFETIEDLRGMLGTPITDENLNDLLQKYDLTKEGLEALLGEFGESIEDYHFIEDLDVTVDFYSNHDQEMLESEQFLAQIGLLEEEVDKLFTHLMSLDELVLEQEMERIMAQLEPFMEIEDPSQLTEAQQQQLLTIWAEMLNAFHVKANFFLVDKAKTAISFPELMKLETLDGRSLLVELTDLQGNLLADFQVSEEMLGSEFILQTGENLIDVGDIAGELTKELHEHKLPNTASPFSLNIILGILLTFAGLAFYRYSRKIENV